MIKRPVFKLSRKFIGPQRKTCGLLARKNIMHRLICTGQMTKNRGNLEVAIECMRRQGMLPRPLAVEELFR